MLKKLLTPGFITSLLGVLAVLAGFFGQSALQAFFTDTDTVQSILTIVGSIAALFGGAMPGAGEGGETA